MLPTAVARCMRTHDHSVTAPHHMQTHLLHILAPSIRCLYSQRPYAVHAFHRTRDSLNLAKWTQHVDVRVQHFALQDLPPQLQPIDHAPKPQADENRDAAAARYGPHAVPYSLVFKMFYGAMSARRTAGAHAHFPGGFNSRDIDADAIAEYIRRGAR